MRRRRHSGGGASGGGRSGGDGNGDGNGDNARCRLASGWVRRRFPRGNLGARGIISSEECVIYLTNLD
jgi:hypothetical protein